MPLEKEEVIFDSENVKAILGMGEVVYPKKYLAKKTVVTDTGVFAPFLDKYKRKKSFSKKEINDLYRKSIQLGIIDHHSIDSFLARREIRPEKCATQIAFDYSNDILRLIKKEKIRKTVTHKKPDFDAIASSYLVQSLIQNGKLPLIAKDLSEVGSLMDYAKFKMLSRNYSSSLPGWVEAIEATLNENDDYEKKLLGIIFEVFNVCNYEKKHNSNFDIKKDMIRIEPFLNKEIIEHLNRGKKKLKKEYANFSSEFNKAKKRDIEIKNKSGKLIKAKLLLVISHGYPTTLLGFAQTKISPNTIVAVYGKKDGKMSNYTVGILPDMAREIDLGDICVILNEEEKKLRDLIYAGDPKEELGFNAKEMNKLKSIWNNEMPRLGMSGPRQVLEKNPTVLVAGGWLIVASRTALLRKKDFIKVFKNI